MSILHSLFVTVQHQSLLDPPPLYIHLYRPYFLIQNPLVPRVHLTSQLTRHCEKRTSIDTTALASQLGLVLTLRRLLT